MSTPTPRKNNIDLRKCKVGQRVKLRNGQEVKLIEKRKGYTFPYVTDHGETYTSKGWYYGSGEESRLDIIALLPLPKKAGKPVKKKASPLDPGWVKGQGDKAAIRRVIKLLKGLLKP